MGRLVLVGLMAAGIGASAAVGGSVSAGAPARAARVAGQTTSRTFVVSAGRAERRFTMREGAGLIRLTRITVPHGARAFVYASIPHVAGVRFSTPRAHADPALACHSKGGYDVCTQRQGWCPMPAAVWQMHLVKSSGPGGRIRVDFVVAAPPNGA